jgi:uncharacterized protein YjbI with pentapeptide repeats
MLQIKHRETGEVLETIQADTLSGQDLREMELSGADLSHADLSNTRLEFTDLTGANLELNWELTATQELPSCWRWISREP